MSRLGRAAIVARLVELLRSRDGWAGETHIQKSVYFLQALLQVPTGWQYSLYKYGPFSFDLRDDLAGMEAEGFLEVEPQRPPYGPRLNRGPRYDLLMKDQAQTVKKYERSLEFVADSLAPKGVGGLERVATALFVTADLHLEGEQRATALHELKPHISLEKAKASVAELDSIQAKAP